MAQAPTHPLIPDQEQLNMPTEPDIDISQAEAESFARRLGLTWMSAEDTTRLREAMVTIARAGLVVPRVSSKFVQPAFAFSVAPRAAISKD
jgi:hypothetical protein